MNITEIVRKELSKYFHVGQVSSNNASNNTVRVAFDDMSGPAGKFVSGEMQTLQRHTAGARHQSLSVAGEHVLCINLPNGTPEGFILGSYYTASNMTDGGGTDVERTTYPDGAVIEYNSGTGTATVRGAKHAKVTVEETVEVIAREVTVTAETVKIIGDVEITGNMKVNGSIDATVDIMAARNSDNHHEH